jgi:ATP-dependent Lhr-like helicase
MGALIRVAVRTGDSAPAERQRMLKRPPHILVTTPESLYLLLTAQRSREILRSVETVIVDEIHAVVSFGALIPATDRRVRFGRG